MNAIPKFPYVRSKKLLEACRRIPCQHCGVRDGTVCAAHSNQSIHGKGRGVKASDIYIASLCFTCHSNLDQGREGSREYRAGLWNAAHEKTVAMLNKLGLWPEGVPQP